MSARVSATAVDAHFEDRPVTLYHRQRTAQRSIIGLRRCTVRTAGTRDSVALVATVAGLMVVMMCATTAAQSVPPDDLYVPAGDCTTAFCHRLWNPSACASDRPGIDSVTQCLPRARPLETPFKEHA